MIMLFSYDENTKRDMWRFCRFCSTFPRAAMRVCQDFPAYIRALLDNVFFSYVGCHTPRDECFHAPSPAQDVLDCSNSEHGRDGLTEDHLELDQLPVHTQRDEPLYSCPREKSLHNRRYNFLATRNIQFPRLQQNNKQCDQLMGFPLVTATSFGAWHKIACFSV